MKTEPFRPLLPGLLFTAVVTAAALLLQSLSFFQRVLPLSALVLAILLGMLIINTTRLPDSFQPGIAFSAKRILRLAIILLGFRLSFTEVGSLGPGVILSIVLASGVTFVLTVLLAFRLGLGWKKSVLMAGGVSICGAAAVAALSSSIRAEKEDSAFSIGMVTLFGTAFLFLYPILFTAFQPDSWRYALWTGESVHEVAQVAAASAVLPDSLRALASTVKMFRVLLIIPLTFVLSFTGRKPANGAGPVQPKGRVSLPWFAILFFAAVMANSLVPMTGWLHQSLLTAGNLTMTAAMAALGLGITFRTLFQGSGKSVVVGLAASLFISAFSWVILGAVLGR